MKGYGESTAPPGELGLSGFRGGRGPFGVGAAGAKDKTQDEMGGGVFSLGVVVWKPSRSSRSPSSSRGRGTRP